jgi:hypothetical protein
MAASSVGDLVINSIFRISRQSIGTTPFEIASGPSCRCLNGQFFFVEIKVSYQDVYS